MCVGDVARLANAWEEGGARVGRLEDGSIVSLAYVPGARAGEYLVVHLGIPVDVISEQAAREALQLREERSVQ